MPKSSYRLQVLKRLTEHLEGITALNDYDYTLTGRVHRGISVFSGDKEQWPLPMLSILESARPDFGLPADVNDTRRKEDWALLVQGWVDDDTLNPTDPAYELVAAVEHRLSRIISTREQDGKPEFPDEYMLGLIPDTKKNWIAGFKFGPSVVRPPEGEVSSKAFFYLPVTITLATKASEPYISI